MNRPARAVDRRPAGRAAGVALAIAFAAGPFPVGIAGASDSAAYEQETELRASQLLSAELLRGSHHSVDEKVTSDGLVPTYTVTTPYGSFQARGEGALRQRIAEARALARLDEAAKAEAFVAAAAEATEIPFVSGGWRWARDPDRAAPGLAPGSLAGGTWGQDEPQGVAASPVLQGFEEKKRKLARRLSVDPYSSNTVLQKQLDRHAWIAFSTDTPSAIESSDAPDATESADNPRVAEILEHYSSDDLERLNRLELVAMGVPEELREKFIENPSYSPRIETVLVDALAGLEGTEDRVTFIEAAVGASSEDAAQAFQHVAEMMRNYSDGGGTLKRFLEVDGQIAAYTQDGTLVVPLMADHAVWTERVEGFAESIAKAAGDSLEDVKARFLVSGSVSSRALDEIRGRGIAVTEGALEPNQEDAADE